MRSRRTLFNALFVAFPQGHVNAKGFTMIELLIAVVVISIGILGTVAAQVLAKKASYDARQRTFATQVAEDVISRMRTVSASNLLPRFAGTYTGELNTPSKLCSTASSNCSATEVIDSELWHWEQFMLGELVTHSGKARSGLTKPTTCITVTNEAVKVVVSWQGRVKTTKGGTEDCGAESAYRRQLVFDSFVSGA